VVFKKPDVFCKRAPTKCGALFEKSPSSSTQTGLYPTIKGCDFNRNQAHQVFVANENAPLIRLLAKGCPTKIGLYVKRDLAM